MMKKLLIALFLSSLLLQPACDESKSNDSGKLLGFGIVYLSSIWQKVTVADVPGFSFLNNESEPKSLTPSCACPPSLEATTGKTTTYNPEFAFFVKRGAVDNNNLLIFFMGGGACWDITNCAYNHTYSGQLIESNMLLGLASTGGAKGRGLSGIMDTTDPNNPFKDWTIVWVPYCTADLGMGQRDNVYTEDDYQPGSLTYPDDKVTIKHRGRVNLELVLQWLQANITTVPDKLFVTGSSAGSYSALLSFPLIRRQFSATPKAYVLGDAGEGVAGTYINGSVTQEFMEIVEGKWGLELPDHDVFGTVFYNKSLKDDYHYNYKELVQAIVTKYSGDRFAQYTTKWDKTQVWFYDIQKDNNIHKPDTWGAEEDAAADPTSDIAKDWNGYMMVSPDGGAINIEGANYRYYIGPGTHHTIVLTPAFYTETSAGTYFFDWVTAFVDDDTLPDSISCSDPTVCDVPSN